jgi:hypothetical protein
VFLDALSILGPIRLLKSVSRCVQTLHYSTLLIQLNLVFQYAPLQPMDKTTLDHVLINAQPILSHFHPKVSASDIVLWELLLIFKLHFVYRYVLNRIMETHQRGHAY